VDAKSRTASKGKTQADRGICVCAFMGPILSSSPKKPSQPLEDLRREARYRNQKGLF